MFNVGIILEELVDYPVHCIILKPVQRDVDISEITEALGNVAGMILSHLIEQDVPHSLMISDEGAAIYIFLRKRQVEKTETLVGFLELSGALKIINEEFYRGASSE